MLWMGMLQAQDTTFIHDAIHQMSFPDLNLTFNLGTPDFYAEREPNEAWDARDMSSIRKYEDSLQGDMYDAEWYMAMGNMYGRLNRPTLSKANYQYAYDNYLRQVNESPEDTEKLTDLIATCFAMEDYENGIRYSDQVLDIDPLDSNAHSMLAWFYIFAGDYRKAVSHGEKSVTRYPECSFGYYSIFMARMYQELVRVTTEEPDTSKAMDFIMSVDMEMLELAIEDYPENKELRACKIGSEMLLFFYEVMMPMIAGGEVMDNWEDFEIRMTSDQHQRLDGLIKRVKELEKDPGFKNNYFIQYCYGAGAILKGDYRAGIKELKQAINSKPMEYRDNLNNNSSCYDNISAAYYLLGDTIEAERWILKKIEDEAGFDPKGEFYYQYGKWRMHNSDYATAEEYMFNALAADSSYALAYAQLANLELLKGNTVKAQEYLELCYQINPDLMELYYVSILRRLMDNEMMMAEYTVDQILNYDPEDWFALMVKEHYWPED